jgi:hypothetical protein
MQFFTEELVVLLVAQWLFSGLFSFSRVLIETGSWRETERSSDREACSNGSRLCVDDWAACDRYACWHAYLRR